ncbi:hypothetical protein UFOVP1078_35 [uncultured Caudovirales phage]|uniref:Uncharacterized protein n=3 Tax=uncultured Caudovirales phage TaxID=2100421 RepID=A0A6J5LR84_9CAUD|nr:hypothetical protein UFOVP289_46 [uncultured Caudovirales phage]CAB4169750.1 hypothetical protein UFOVP900_5 [uncultured Caudovirales phage]CAB4182995.1 hypothetical protein UFOVP1078_35 [uncultured Caudovirales phage]CAB4197681.1 hypothetical protein UFOVP1317_25 [uncultured Caudovirales phage]CAB4210481.1 hypothetical protein UFOVP1429_20 [uncultured Caudovirales phage]
MSKLIPSYEEQLTKIEELKARIRVLEKALVASEKDYEKVVAFTFDAFKKLSEIKQQ